MRPFRWPSAICFAVVPALLTATCSDVHCPNPSTSCVDYSQYLSWTGWAPIPGSAVAVAASGTTACVADGNLQVFEIGSTGTVQLVGFLDLGGRAFDVTIDGTRAYATGGTDGLHIVDLANPAQPTLLGSIATGASAFEVSVAGNLAFVTDYDLHVIDVSDPAAPVILSSYDATGRISATTPQGNLLFVAATDEGLLILDITNPSSPQLVGSVDTPDSAVHVAVAGDHVLVADDRYLRIVDVTDPSQPRIVASPDLGSVHHVTVSGEHAYLSHSYPPLRILDISEPTAPRLVGTFRARMHPYETAIAGDVLLVATSELPPGNNSELHVVDVSRKESAPYHGGVMMDGLIEDATLNGSILALANSRHGLQLFDANTPRCEVLVGSIGLPNGASNVTVSNNIAYVTDRARGLHVIDISAPSAPQAVGAIALPDHALDLFLTDDHLYVAEFQGAMHIVDVTSPAAPTIVGSLALPAGVFGVRAEADLAYVATYEGLVTVDTGDKSAPSIISTIDTGSIGALARAGNYLFAAGRLGFMVFDVRQPAAPALVANLPLPGQTRSLIVHGNYAYVMGGPSGVQVIDVRNPTSPLFVGILASPLYARSLPDVYNGVIWNDRLILTASSQVWVASLQCP